MRTVQKAALLKTSVKTDVKRSGGVLAIPGWFPVREASILDVKQFKYKAEVVQVVKIGYSGYTPTANTTYKVRVSGFNNQREGYTNPDRTYAYTTPAVVTIMGATAALQREYIHGKLITQINADHTNKKNFVTAASLTGGDGFTLTDDTGYFPARPSSGRTGATVVTLLTNEDGSGWVNNSLENLTTTAAVYSFGEGTRIAQDTPVLYAYTQNLASGELGTGAQFPTPVALDGTYAVAGQKYDAFLVSSLTTASANAITDQQALQPVDQMVFVDNGTGTSTSNLAGFKAFRREFHRLLFGQYSGDPSATIDFFGQPIMLEGALGAAPATTGTQKMFSEAKWQYTQIGTQTVVGPVISATGLLLDQDLTDTEGAEYTPSILTNDAREFTVGKTAFSCYAVISAGDCTDVGYLVGFRRKAAVAADWNDYTDLAGIGGIATVAGGTPNGDLISTNGILNNAATVTTSTGVVPADGVTYTVEVLVAVDGTVTCKVNGTVYPVYSTGTTALVFDAGDIMIPFFRAVNISGGDPDAVVEEFVAISADNWKL